VQLAERSQSLSYDAGGERAGRFAPPLEFSIRFAFSPVRASICPPRMHRVIRPRMRRAPDTITAAQQSWRDKVRRNKTRYIKCLTGV
jgi:hypothetical protein